MIRISKGTSEKYVTKGAYENFYKPLGYNIIGNDDKAKREVEVKEEIKKDEIVKDSEDKGEKKSQKVEEFKKR